MLKYSPLKKRRDEKPTCSAVIVAAGSSQRMGSDKIMMKLGAMPVLARTVLAFENNEYIDEIIIVTRTEKLQEIADMCHKNGLHKVKKVISGGATRMESALAGVSAARHGAELIAIHDGARPLVSQGLISRTILAAREWRSVVPAIASTDTLKTVDARGSITGTGRAHQSGREGPDPHRRLLRHGDDGDQNLRRRGGSGEYQDHNARGSCHGQGDCGEQGRSECESDMDMTYTAWWKAAG